MKQHIKFNVGITIQKGLITEKSKKNKWIQINLCFAVNKKGVTNFRL